MENYVEPIVNNVQNVNWAVPTWDLFIILMVALSLFLYGFTLGRDRVVAIMVSIYMALAITSYAPVLAFLDKYGYSLGSNFAFKLVAFWVLFVMVSVFFTRSVFGEIVTGGGRWWQLAVFNVLHVGLLVSITLSFLPPESLNYLHFWTKQIFISEVASVLWVLSPLVFLSIIKATD